MSNSNVKILQCKQYIWKGNYKYSIELGIFKKMATFDDDMLFKENLDNLDNLNNFSRVN